MALHLGSGEKLKIATPNGAFNIVIPSSFIIINGIKLLSFDNYVLKASNGTYLTAKEREQS